MKVKKEDKKIPLYMISVVSKMLEVHPQTLRMYEKEGFICPKRLNKQRMYSEEDIEKLNLVIKLTKEFGVNKAGVDIILRMRSRIEALQEEMKNIMKFVDDDVKKEFERRLKNLFNQNKE
ncbi:MAG: MerR family transcriptional regulator [Thermodesulfovibrionales bacterium]|nr:MerR family transcriptional regulator [Thermodesulfovibrionales bacterium]